MREKLLNNKNFVAQNWFNTSHATSNHISSGLEKKSVKDQLAPFNLESIEQKDPGLCSFFVPGWKGESLISKDVKKFKQILDLFQLDARKFFSKKEELSRKIKISIYNEFLSFAEEFAVNCTDLDNYASFWSEINNKESKYFDTLERFINILSFRMAVIYLLKVRFILTLQNQSSLDFDIKSVFYPNSYLSKIFKTASSTELKTKVFDQNVFSWYRPSEELKSELYRYKNYCSSLKITDIIKAISLKSEKILELKTNYSHALSHKKFGLFLNNLLINFPVWLESLSHNKSFSQKQNPEVLSTKFAGDDIESLAVSHWLAQASNQFIKWDKILCPDFKKNGFIAGLYLKSIHELQFLTFLAEIAHIQGQQPVPFVSNIINSHLHNRKKTNNSQRSLLCHETSETHSTYDRIVLNISQFPKNNPQHFLFSKIQEQKEFLKENGHIYVLTSKKIFIPSQKAKVENLTKDFKVEGIFSLSEVKGKGEIASYIYILSLRSHPIESVHKHSCLRFRLSGHLNTFQEFSHLTNLSQEFFEKNLSDLPPLYQKSRDEFKIEFFQDAIVNGQLIHSSSKDSSNITHPHFFKKLMGLCNSLDFFFDIQAVDFNDGHEENSLFNFSHSFRREESDYIIIVDQRCKNETRTEVIPTSTLEAKSYEYGHALCSYYYAYPKWPNLNYGLLRDYLSSKIGQQITNLTFNNELRKIKGNLNKLLVPKYFLSHQSLPEHIASGLALLSSNPNQVLSLHPTELLRALKEVRTILPSIATSYPKATLELVSQFKRSLTQCKQQLGQHNKKDKFNFKNPILKSPLLLSKTYPIYPDNQDIYIEFNTDALEKIHRPLDKIKIKSVDEHGETNHSIALKSEDQTIATIHSQEEMICFLEFLLNNITGVAISKVLQSVQTPKIEDLKSILAAYKSLQETISQVHEQITRDIDLLINSTILDHK